MAALDTNVLVRYLVQDDAVQHAAADALIEGALINGESLFVPISVTLELEWVLRSRYHFGKHAFEMALSQLLEADELLFESETAVEIGLRLYHHSSADFADALHAALARAADQTPLWTFDRAAAQLAGARLLARA